MAIQNRRGNEVDFQPGKMLPGEYGFSVDEQRLHAAFGSNKVKTVAFIEDMASATQQAIRLACEEAEAWAHGDGFTEYEVNEDGTALVPGIEHDTSTDNAHYWSNQSHTYATNSQNSATASQNSALASETSAQNSLNSATASQSSASASRTSAQESEQSKLEAADLLEQVKEYASITIPDIYLDPDDGNLYVSTAASNVDFYVDEDCVLYYKFVA